MTWLKASGYNSAADWLHEDDQAYYEKRSKIYDAARERAEEIVAYNYPDSVKKFLKSESKKIRDWLTPLTDAGKEAGRAGKISGSVGKGYWKVVTSVQQKLLSGILAEENLDNMTTKQAINRIKEAGYNDIPKGKKSVSGVPLKNNISTSYDLEIYPHDHLNPRFGYKVKLSKNGKVVLSQDVSDFTDGIDVAYDFVYINGRKK